MSDRRAGDEMRVRGRGVDGAGDGNETRETSGSANGGNAMSSETNGGMTGEATPIEDQLGLEGELKAMAKRMRAQPGDDVSAEPPAGLEDALLGDLHQAMGTTAAAFCEAAEDQENSRGSAGGGEIVAGPWRRLVRSPGLRAAAALLVLVGFSALLVRGGFFREGTDRLRAEEVLSEDLRSEFEVHEIATVSPGSVGASAPSSSETFDEQIDVPVDMVPLGESQSRSPTPLLDAAMANASRNPAEIERLEPSSPVEAAPVPPRPAAEPPHPNAGTLVESETPTLDERKLRQGAQISQADLEKIPTARDPWAVLNQTPGTLVDRVNVGGNESVEQAATQEPFEVDGVDITDLRATGASPTFHDFDQYADSAAAEPSAAPLNEVVTDDSSEKLKALGYLNERESDQGAKRERREGNRRDLVSAIEERARKLREQARTESSVADAEPALDSDRIFVEERAREVPTYPRVHVDRFDAMTFRDYGISPFVETARDAQSTFGLEVDTGSFNLARRYLDAGTLPPPEAIRVEEIVNALDYSDPAPRRDDFGLSVEGTVSPFDARKLLLRVGVKARELEERERPAAALTFLIDTSGSMNRENRLGLVQRSLEYLIDQLEPGDTVAIVTYGSRGRVELEPTGDRERIRSVVRSLRPGGSTNLEEGMRLAYEIAGRRARSGAVSRVILCSDGVANVGLTDAEALLRSVAQWGARGVELTAVGVGLGNYNDEMLERLADRGDGRYAYVDQLDETRRLFVEDLTGTLFTVGKDARVQVTFDASHVSRYRLIGYENRAIPDHRFRDRRTDGGEIGAGHAVTAVYEIELRDGRAPGWFDRVRGESLGEVALVYRRMGQGGPASDLSEISVPIRTGVVSSRFERASSSLRLAVVAARFAEILRVSPYVEGDLSALLEQAQAVVPAFPGDRRVVQFADMIGAARDLLRGRALQE